MNKKYCLVCTPRSGSYYVLEHIARHRTADIRAETQGRKRDIIGRIERSIFEPLCYIVGKVKLQWRNKW